MRKGDDNEGDKKPDSPKGAECVLDFYEILKESKQDRENFAVQALDT